MASAQTAPSPWHLNGSDTLELIVKDAISAAQTAPNGTGGVILTPGSLVYDGGGSGTAESNNLANKQSIAPMSRNYSFTVLSNNPSWQPTPSSVVALDAAVIATRNYPSRIKTFPAPNAANAAELTNKAIPNTFTGAPGACSACAPGTPCTGCTYDPGTPASGYSQLIEVIVSGVDGSGTYAACADPRRAQAISDFASRHGVTTIDTFYRRDDNSGTSNIFQDKMAVGRFCNGRARGVLGANTVDALNHNLNNQDLDPVRRICQPPGPGRARTTCTNLATGLICQASDNPAGCVLDGSGVSQCPCTQGLVVALSDGDNATTLVDVTTTIGSRVAADVNNRTFGYAGREAAFVTGATAPFVDGAAYSDQNVRNDGYLLSRRLYVNFASTVTGAGTGGGGAPQVAAEATLFNFMTDPSGASNADGSTGPCNLDQPGTDATGKPLSIVKKHGFIPCTPDCAASRTGTLCGKTISQLPARPDGSLVPPPAAGTFPASLSTLAACYPDGTGGAATIWNYGALTGAGTKTCCSNNAAAVGGNCNAAIPTTKWASGSLMACTQASECASNSCIDGLGTGVLQCQ